MTDDAPKRIPHLAKGGVVTRPTLRLIGDAGPKVVIPLTPPHEPEWSPEEGS